VPRSELKAGQQQLGRALEQMTTAGPRIGGTT
jgi:hypothetical protein